MASIDADQFPLSSDKNPIDFECHPCKDEGLVREAKFNCPECSEYFCSTCKAFHGRLKATKSHKVVSTKETTKTIPRKTVKLTIMTCVCNRDTLVEFICEEHKCLICSECKIMNHRKCKTGAIKEKSKLLNQEVEMSLLKQANSLKDLADDICAEHSKSQETFEASKVKCKENIIKIRDQLVTFIEKLASMALDELDATTVGTSESPSNDLLACKTVIEKMKQDQTLFRGVLDSGDFEQMFIADYLLVETIKKYARYLEEVKTEREMTSIVFKANSGLVEIQSHFKKIGDIMMEHKENQTKSFPNSLLSLTQVKNELFDITPPGVKRMTSSSFLPNGDLVVCDFESRTVIVLDRAFKEKSRLTMPDRVWGVSVLGVNDVIVSLTNLKKLQIVEVVPVLKLKSSIEVGMVCFDVKVIGSRIYVVCTSELGWGEIRVLDNDGNLIHRLGIDKDGAYLLKHPIHMASNHDQDKIFVAELTSNPIQVVCMAVDGNVLFNFSNTVVENPRGILVDEEGNFLLCSNDIIYLIEAGSNNCTTFLTKSDGLKKEPYALCYRESDRSLVVTHQTSLLVFKLFEK